MRWAPEHRRQPGHEVSFCGVDLRLGEEDSVGQTAAAQVSVAEICTTQIGQPKVGIPQIRRDQVGPMKIGCPQVGPFEVCPYQVSATVAPLVAGNCRPHQLAGLLQQWVDAGAKRRHVDAYERIWTTAGEPVNPDQRVTELVVDRACRWHAQRFGQVPEQLVQLPHDREYREHLCGGRGYFSPVAPAEGDLGDLLPCTEAVKDCAARKPPVTQKRVDATAEVRSQVQTRLPGLLVDREVRRRSERQRNAAQSEAACAVGLEAWPASTG
jgi:hypothetical protein